jgi:hypothetical protein
VAATADARQLDTTRRKEEAMIENPDETYERGYTVGWQGGYQQALMNIYVDLEAMTDGAGSLNGGDTVEYIYNLFAVHGIKVEETIVVEMPGPMMLEVDWNECTVAGTRDELLLLARSIHDIIEGADHGAGA